MAVKAYHKVQCSNLKVQSNTVIKDYFKIDKNPKKGLMALEWGMLGYMAITIITMLFTYTKLVNPEAMLWGRLRVLVITFALWAVYRMIPCRITKMVRIIAQMALLAWWYPDTYEINRMFPNLDHIFAGWEQDLFGCQPALLFAKAMPWAVVSELMSMGYFMYYPMIALVSFYYFFCRYYEAERAAFVMLASFFIYYLVYIYVPVVGPTFYFDAVGISEITKGIFPALGDYFNTHTNCLPTPGYTDGIFYQLVEDAKNAGERPTAAFPSSHVGVSTICMLLVWHAGNRKMLYVMLPFYIFLCLATVYIQAHYLIDAIAGLISAVVIYFALMAVSKGMIEHHTPSSRLRFR